MALITYDQVKSKIIEIRKQKVILDADVAVLYGVETRDINKAVKNNPDKFPKNYIITLSKNEKLKLVENFHRFNPLKHSTSLPKAFTEKRHKKLDNFFEKEWIRGYETINPDAKKMIIITSFTSYTAKEFVKNNPEFGLIIMKIIKPLDERVLENIKGKQEIIFAESNYSGQLENYMTKELGLKFIDWLKISNIRKYDLFPFYIEDFNELKK